MQMHFWGKDFLNFDMPSFFLSRQKRWTEHTQEEKMREVRTDPETARDYAEQQKWYERLSQEIHEDRGEDRADDLRKGYGPGYRSHREDRREDRD